MFSSLPAWADYYFWAPEISVDNGKVFVYYSAHKRGGNFAGRSECGQTGGTL